MSFHETGWASLNHGGLLLSRSKLTEYFPDTLAPLPDWQADRLRRAVTAFDGSAESLTALLDYLLEQYSDLPAEQWQKAQAVEQRWSLRSFTGNLIKPRRLWLGPNGEVLPLFVPDETSRQFRGRLGVGRSRQLLSRVVEWLRRQQQPLALVTNGRQWRLIHAGTDYEAWCEWDIDLWFVEGQPGPQAQAWRHLLSPQTLFQDNSGQSPLLLAISESRKGQAELSAVLGERVRQAVEELITASHAVIEQAQQTDMAPTFTDLYLAGTRLIMRCIITLFAEARGLLPVDNTLYQQSYSVEGLRQQLDRRAGSGGQERLTQGRSAWPRLIALFSLTYHGSAHEALPVPHYGGELFAPGDANSSDPVSRALAILESSDNLIDDRQVRSVLRLLTRTRQKVRMGKRSTWVDGPVDFSQLSSEYIGILYEGLLDYELRQTTADDPVIFLSVGRQPALTLSQLESMDDKAIKQLFEVLKKKEKAGGDEGDEADDSVEDDDSAEEDDSITQEDDNDQDDSSEADESDEPSDLEVNEELALTADHIARANAWLERAAVLAGLVKKPRGRQQQLALYDEALARAVKQLKQRLVAPGQFYLVRWGGTRKGAGTFYTRPQLAAPTVRRTLQPLVYVPIDTSIDARTGLEEVTSWVPRKPEEILSLKICDPAMGSGSFLAGALRYLTDALVESLYHHGLIQRDEQGGIPRLADGRIAELLSDELPKLRPDDERFEELLRAQLKRHIVERCLYGVDLDPLAVELGRMALWVETMDRELPFGFLDHKLKTGNALVGTWFDTCHAYPALAWQREGGDSGYQKDKPKNLINHWFVDAKGKRRGDKYTRAISELAKEVPSQLIAQLNGQLALGETISFDDTHTELQKIFEQLHRLPVGDTENRAQLYKEKVLDNPHYHALKAHMDLWCALWFWPGDQLESAPLPRDFQRPTDEALAIITEVAARQRFFHWELEFPDVFNQARHGFDAILGNPPWEIQKPNSKEFFSNYDPLYRAYGKQEALAKQLDYFHQTPQLEHDWIAYNASLKAMSNWIKRVGEPFGNKVFVDKNNKKKHELSLGGRGKNSFAASTALHGKWAKQRKQWHGFADTQHPFLHQGSADLNTYKMFLEQSHALLNESGRLGMIAPSGIYTDKGTAELRKLFLDSCAWEWLFGFENREGIFDIHRSFKFCALVLQKSSETDNIRAAFMHRNVDDWAQGQRFVLAYPRARVLEFSPNSRAILEIRSEQDLQVLQKIYANGVLLGDQNEDGWGVKYAREFDMTTDSKLFPPRPKWEAKGYQPDEYGHWLKGPWRDYQGPQHILEREAGLVLSRDGTQALAVEEIEDVALPLYQGVMFRILDPNAARYESGAGNRAKWTQQDFEKRYYSPQFLMKLQDYVERRKSIGAGLLFRDLSNPTNTRTMIAAFCPDFPSGNKSPKLSMPGGAISSLSFTGVLSSLVFDYGLRIRFATSAGASSINPFILYELAVCKSDLVECLAKFVARLSMTSPIYSPQWLQLRSHFGFNNALGCLYALTIHERARCTGIINAIVFSALKLDEKDVNLIIQDCDYPIQLILDKKFSKLRNPKGFWRIDKEKYPELRGTLLSLVALRDLNEKGLEGFLAQNNGEGWLIPETLRLADYGLGHDDRAQHHQPVASRLGPRFYDWQLNEDVERSWQECAAHAELLRRIVPLPEVHDSTGVAEPAADFQATPQGELF